MAKLAQSTIKYLIEATFDADGVVEKPDVIGAVFGQTEGLLGVDLDLRELQRTGRIGRIDVNISTSKGKTRGKIEIPSSLDGSETALIAAAIETIERIGPCDSKIKIKSVKDIRALKRDYVIDRAKRILKRMMDEEMPDTNKLTDSIKKSVRAAEIVNYRNLAAGPDVDKSEEIIIVEGRADVVNLLKNGIRNTVAMGGATISPEIIKLCKQKTTTFFLDGDRGGDLILKEITQLADIDFVARAPPGKEVEELTKKEIFSSLREKIPFSHLTSDMKKELGDKEKEKIKENMEKMVGTKAAYVFDGKMKLLNKIPLKQFNLENKDLKNAEIVLIDDLVDENYVDVAESLNVKFLVGNKKKKEFKTKFLTIYTKGDF
jgi:DNA primase